MDIDLEIKKNLAFAYQIIAKLGLDDHTYTHLSARPAGADYYYIYPFGLRFGEVETDNLLKVSLTGEILQGEEYQYNQTGYVIHGNIYQARPDLNSIFHLHTVATVAVSTMREGLLPISQWALHFYQQIAYHDYNSLSLDYQLHGKALINDLADKKLIFLRNHGYIACGATIWETMFYCHHLEYACKTQIAALSSNQDLIIPSAEICRQAHQDLINFEQDLGRRDWEAWIRWLEQKNH